MTASIGRLLLCLGLLTLLLSGASLAQAHAEDEPFVLVGKLPYAYKAAGFTTMFLDPGVRRGFMVRDGSITVSVFDLDTNEKIKDIEHPGPSWNDGSATPTSVGGFAVDTVHHRLFIGSDSNLGSEVDTCNTNAFFTNVVHVVHTDTLAVEEIPVPCPDPVNGIFQQGLWYDEGADRLYVLTYASQFAKTVGGSGTVPIYVMRLDPSTGTADPAWPAVQVGPPCTQFSNNFPAPQGLVRRVGNKVVGLCNSQNGTQNYGFTIPLNPDGTPDSGGVTSRPLIGGLVGASFDDDAGLMLLTTAVQGNAIGTYVLDSDFHFLGTVAAGDTTVQARIKAVGVDQSRGRLYQQNKNGLIVADVRHSPLPSGLSYAELRYKHNPPPEVNGTIMPVDPTTHRIYVPDPDGNQFLVYEDRLADIPETPAVDVDAGTSGVPEIPGKTAVNYTGNANAFGLSWLSRGGPAKPITNTDIMCYGVPPTAWRTYLHEFRDGVAQVDEQAAENFDGDCIEDVLVKPGDRAWFAGRVSKLALSNGGADVAVAPVHVSDAPTQKDMAKTEAAVDRLTESVPVAPKAGETNNEFPGGIAACRDFDQGGTGQESSSQLGTASVKCQSAKGLVTGDVEFAGANLANPGAAVSVSQALTNVSSVKDPNRGLVTKATAVSRGIQIGDAIWINEIRTEAETWANGQAGGAGGRFTRTIRGYNSPTYKCSEDCNPEQVVKSLNSELQIVRAEAFVPEPDQTFLGGSPGGYQALVTKNDVDRVSDSTVNNDYRDTVAGLKLVFYSDGNLGPSRQIFDFAAVHAESHYGVYSLDAGSGGDDLLGLGGGLGAGDYPTVGPSSPSIPGPTYVVNAPEKLVERIIQRVVEVAKALAKEAWRLIVSEPGSGLRLMLALLILAAPLYLALRRVHFVHAALGPRRVA